MNPENQISLKCFLECVKTVAINANNLEGHKRRLSEAVHQIEDYIECFGFIDLDKKGAIYPKVLQNFLIKHQYYIDPITISRFYCKYSHEKAYLSYEDILEALLPHQDYVLVSNTLSNRQERAKGPFKFSYACREERGKTLQYFTAFVLQLEIEYLRQDFSRMRQVTKNSQRIGAILWRLLDRNHHNQLSYEKLRQSSEQLKVPVSQTEWEIFLYWHLHSHKSTIDRADFMRILDIQEQLKRASSECKIQQFKIEQQIFKRAEEDRLSNIRIEQAVRDKIAMMPHFTKSHYRQMARVEQFPFQSLTQKKELRGKPGYRRPTNLIKYVVERKQ